MGRRNKIENKAEQLVGKAKKTIGDATGNKEPEGQRPISAGEGESEAGRREGKGRPEVN